MRISSNSMYNFNVAMMNQLQSQLTQTQEQAASGTQLLNAATDPVAYAQTMLLKQTDAVTNQQAANITSATNTLSIAGNTMMSATNLLQSIRSNALTAEDGNLSNSARATMANTLNGQLQQLMGLANSTDGTGNYLFAGYHSGSAPFSINSSRTVVYSGDAGQQLVQANSTRQIAVNDNGQSVFMNILNGNGTFTTNAAAANTGGGVIDAGSVVGSPVSKDSYSIAFSVTAGVTTYTVTDTTTSTTVGTANQPYTSGQAISFGGMQVTISGVPANADTFTVAPSTNQSIFQTISNMVKVLSTPAVGASVTNGITQGIRNIDNAISHFSNVEASQGLRLNELSMLQTASTNMDLQLKQNISTLADTNYTSTITALNQQQLALQAAQKSYAQVASLSMFTYL
jgi:flagellar hook-associated protein 3 FlgL